MNATGTTSPGETDAPEIADEQTTIVPLWQKRLGVIFGFVALAVILVMYWVPQYRGDEYISVVLRTQLSWPELLTAIRTDPAPGPFYILMKPWSMVSTETWWMRLPIVFSMAATVGVLVGLVRRALGTREAIFTGLAMLALPAVSRWGTDVRPYAFATFAAVVAVSLWWTSMGDRRVRWSIGYGLAVAGMGLFHLYTLTMLPVLFLTVFALGKQDLGKRLLRTAVPAAAGVLLIAPHIYLNIAHPTGSAQNPPVSVASVRLILLQMVGPTWLLIAVVAVCLTGVVAMFRSKSRRPIALLAVLWVTVPPVLLALAHIAVDISTMVSRYYVFCLPGVALLMGVGLGYLSQRWLVISVLAITVVGLLGLPVQYQDRQFDGHSATNRIHDQLDNPALAGWPIVGAVPGDDHLVNSAFFPELILTPRDAPLEPVAVVFRKKRLNGAPDKTGYLAPDSQWRVIITCPVSPTREFLIVANPEGVTEIGNVNELLDSLNAPGEFKKRKCRLN